MSLKVWLPLNGDLRNQGTSNAIIINNGATVNTSGKIGSCYYFNASSYLYENTYDWTDFNTSQFSLCCWYKQPSPVASGNSQMICIGTNSGWNNIRIGLLRRTSNGYPMFSVSDGSNAVNYNCTATKFPLDTWNHIVCTYNAGEINIYLNGEWNKSYTTTIVPVLNSSQHLGIGAASNGAEKLIGYLNDVRIYDHCLSAAEVKEISQGLVVHYKLDGMNPNYILNSSGVFLTNLGSAQGSRQEYRAKSLGQNLPITSGTTITISFDLHMEFNTANAYLYVYNTNNKGPHQTINGINALAGRTVAVGDIINERISVTGTITDRDSPTQTTDYIEFYSNYGSNNWYSISNIKLEIGRAATPYIPAGIEIDTTKIEDSSGYNHHAISNGSVTTTLDSDTPRYDCSTKFISGARIATPVASSTFLPTNAITVSIWYKSSSGTTRFLSCTESGGWNFEVSSSKASFPFYINGKGYGRIISTRNFYSDNQWHMITVTYDGISTGKWYWDGVLDNTITITSGWENLPIKYNANTPLTLGAEAQTIASPIAGTYVGNLSDFRVYCTALDADAIRQLYEVGAKIDNKKNLHTYELIENSSTIKINKRGQTLCNELQEGAAMKFYKTDSIIETHVLNEF